MQIPTGEHLELVPLLWFGATIASFMLILISFRFLALRWSWLLIGLFVGLFIQPLWIVLSIFIPLTYHEITPFLTHIFYYLFFFTIFFFFYKKRATLAHFARALLLSRILGYGAFIYMLS